MKNNNKFFKYAVVFFSIFCLPLATHAMAKKTFEVDWKKRGRLYKTGVILTGAVCLDEVKYQIQEKKRQQQAAPFFEKIYPLLLRKYEEKNLTAFWGASWLDLRIDRVEPTQWNEKKKLLIEYLVTNFDLIDEKTLKVCLDSTLKVFGDGAALNCIKILIKDLPYILIKSSWHYSLHKRHLNVADYYDFSKRLGAIDLKYGLAWAILKNIEQKVPLEPKKLECALEEIKWDKDLFEMFLQEASLYTNIPYETDAKKIEDVLKEMNLKRYEVSKTPK